MGSEWVIFFSAFFIVLAIVASLFALRTIRKERQKRENQPIETLPAMFLGTNYPFDSQSSQETKGDIVTFRLNDQRIMSFKVKPSVKQLYQKGESGHLSFQGPEFVAFIVTGKNQDPEADSSFVSKEPEASGVMVYGEARGLGLSIPSLKPLHFSQQDLQRLIDDLKEDDSDWFLVIQNDRGESLQIERENDLIRKCTLWKEGVESATELSHKDLTRQVRQLF